MIDYNKDENVINAKLKELNIDQLLDALTDAKFFAAEWSLQLKNAEKGEKDTQAKIDALEEQIKREREVRNEYRDIIANRKPEVQKLTRVLSTIDHLIRRLQLAQTQAREFAKMAEEFDLRTQNAPWRSRALPHQLSGAKALASCGGRAFLGDETGLGKTLTSQIFLDMLRVARCIVIAPKETINNFENEIREWSPKNKETGTGRTLVSLTGKSKAQLEFLFLALREQEEFILTLNIEAWRKNQTIIDELIKLKLEAMIIDEAHVIKEPKSNAARGVMNIVHAENQCFMPNCEGEEFIEEYYGKVRCSSCDHVFRADDRDALRSIKYVLPMTATGILNRPNELWVALNLIDRKSFPSMEDFIYRYCYEFNGKVIFRPGGEAALFQQLGPQFIKRTKKSSGVIIPPQKIQIHNLELSRDTHPLQWRAYRELQEQQALFLADGGMDDEGVKVQSGMVHLLRKRQMIVLPKSIVWRLPKSERIIFECDVDESVKMDAAEKLIQKLVDEGERVVVFSQFKPPLYELAARLEKSTIVCTDGEEDFIRPVILDGDTKHDKRAAIRYDFDRKTASEDEYRWDVVLCNFKVGGQSINLTAATHTIVLDEEWNPGKNTQAYDRTYRIGQTEETTVHVFRARLEVNGKLTDTVDTYMADLNERKARINEGFEIAFDEHKEIMHALKSGAI